MRTNHSSAHQQSASFQPPSAFRQMPFVQQHLGQPIAHSSSTTNLNSGSSNHLSGVLNRIGNWISGRTGQGSQSGQRNGINLQNANVEFTAKPNSIELDIETPKQKGGKRSLDIDLNVEGIGTNNLSQLTGALEGVNGLVSNAVGQTNVSSKPNQPSSQPARLQTAQGINNRLDGATIELDVKPNSVHFDLETPKAQTGQQLLDVDVDLQGVGTRNLSRLTGAISGINDLVSGLLQQNSQNPLKVDLDVSVNQSSRPQKPSASGISSSRPRRFSTRFTNPAGKPPRPRSGRQQQSSQRPLNLRPTPGLPD
ncbi:hypothetical protein [Leptothermofonsia sp. ETS-13]|uniref:hypothetical protein n=1 Tax=Leptothermofonsia sp. ETS-13 TaxID=3035696 RepID=UPI003B9E2B40